MVLCLYVCKVVIFSCSVNALIVFLRVCDILKNACGMRSLTYLNSICCIT